MKLVINGKLIYVFVIKIQFNNLKEASLHDDEAA